MQADSGTIERARHVRLGHLTQTMTVEGERSLYEEVREAFRPLLDMQTDMMELEARMAQNQVSPQELQHYGTLLEEFNLRQGYHTGTCRSNAVRPWLSPYGLTQTCTPAQRSDRKTWRHWRVLLQEPDLLLLDEPSNHLDITATEWLEGTLRTYPGTVVVVSHDRYFLDRTVEEIVELDSHHLQSYGNYSAYVQAKAVQRAQQRKAYDQQQAEIQRQEEFIRRNIAGQKPVRRRAGRKCCLAWSGWRSPPPTSPRCNSISPPAVVRVMRSSSAARSASRLEITPYCATCRTIYRGDKVGLVGPNGAGKSTFLRLLMDLDTPDHGVIRRGRKCLGGLLRSGIARFTAASYRPRRSVGIEPWKTAGEMRSYLARFLFRGEEVQQTIDTLSGGEKAAWRWQTDALPANFLVLDEPTNHLDIPAREALEEALIAYPGRCCSCRTIATFSIA